MSIPTTTSRRASEGSRPRRAAWATTRCAAHARAGRAVPSEPDATAEHVGEHPEVAGEAVERVLEGGGPVALDEEVADPGEAIAEDRHQRQEPPARRDDGVDQGEQDQQRAGEVEAARAAAAVLGQIERIEVPEGAVHPRLLTVAGGGRSGCR